MQKQNNDYYVCKRLRLCHFLLMKGFNFDSYRPDKYNPKFLVWIFKNSDKLQLNQEQVSPDFSRGVVDLPTLELSQRILSLLIHQGILEQVNLLRL